MDTILNDWLNKVQELQKSIKADLGEIRKIKAELQDMRPPVYSDQADGLHITHAKRITLAAPEVIIGNVDSSGELYQTNQLSSVTLRANSVALNGVAATLDGVPVGGINLLSPTITSEAVDPGKDGLERVVLPYSRIVSQARNVVLAATEATQNTWHTSAVPKHLCGVDIYSEYDVDIEAAQSIEAETKTVNDDIKFLDDRIQYVNKVIPKLKAKVSEYSKKIDSYVSSDDKVEQYDENDVRTNVLDLMDQGDDYKDLIIAFQGFMEQYMLHVSALAEYTRQKEAKNAYLKELKNKKNDFDKKSTGASITLNSERISVSTTDGDGKIRENLGSGVTMRTKHFVVATQKDDGSLLDDSIVAISTQNVHITTANPKRKDKDKPENSDNPADGNLVVTSKNILIDSVDREIKDSKYSEKALTKDGKITLRAETINVEATDTKGKATGSIAVNAKDVAVKSFDVKREDGKPDTDDKLAAGGSLRLAAETLIAGSPNKDNKTKTLQLAADKALFAADTTAELQQGEAKAVVTLDGGNITAGGSKLNLTGTTTLTGTADIKGEVKTPKVTADNVEAKSSFKSTNISDGVPIPPSPPSGSVSAKLKKQ